MINRSSPDLAIGLYASTCNTHKWLVPQRLCHLWVCAKKSLRSGFNRPIVYSIETIIAGGRKNQPIVEKNSTYNDYYLLYMGNKYYYIPAVKYAASIIHLRDNGLWRALYNPQMCQPVIIHSWRRKMSEQKESWTLFLACIKLLAGDFNPAAGLDGFIQLYLVGNGQIHGRNIHRRILRYKRGKGGRAIRAEGLQAGRLYI